MLNPRDLLRGLTRGAEAYAPNPGQVAAVALLIVALTLDTGLLYAVVAAVSLYGLAYDATAPELIHEYCPCPICTTPPIEITGDLR